ncbi:MAG: DUF2306 domain-containing protein [Proteobacteria bacterium]|nr:DUF2306 domain-containing protein [Pseudomonadota bacterium]
MATDRSQGQDLRAARAKLALYVAIGAMLAFVLAHNERFLVDPADPAWPHLRAFAPWLLPHGLVGGVALLLGLTQFSTRLRVRHAAVHRACGWAYVCAVAVAAPLGAVLAFRDQEIGYAPSFGAAGCLFAFLWLLATGMALWFILHREVDRHRRWMTRSLAIALVFLEVRVVEGLTGWGATPASDEMIVWLCVALGYPLADLALELGDRLGMRAGGAGQREAGRPR